MRGNDAAHVSVLLSLALVGVMLTADTTGAVFEMVTAELLSALPLSRPSLGVTVQTTLSPASKLVPLRLLLDPLTLLPFTVHA